MLSLLKTQRLRVAELAYTPAAIRASTPFPLYPPFKSSHARSHTTIVAPELTEKQKLILLKNLYEFQNKKLTIPWYQLAIKYRVSVDTLQQILSDDDARKQRESELRIKINKAAKSKQFFNPQTGGIDWDKLAAKFGVSLLGCLRFFDKTKSKSEPRALPPLQTWTRKDANSLLQFVSTHFKTRTTEMWELTGLYFNADAHACYEAHKFFMHPRLTAEMVEDIKKQRELGAIWPDLYAKYWMFSSRASLMSGFYSGAKPAKKNAGQRPIEKLSKADRQKARVLVKKHQYTHDVDGLVELAAKEFTDKPSKELKVVINTLTAAMRRARVTKKQLLRMQQLVREYGEDWERIDVEMGFFPGKAKHNWKIFGSAVVPTSKWSHEDIAKLQHCIDLGMGDTDTARFIGTKIPSQCAQMRMKLANRVDGDETFFHRRIWNEDDDRKFVNLAMVYRRDSGYDWKAISKELGRSVRACRDRYFTIKTATGLSEDTETSTSTPTAAVSVADIVSNEVERQINSEPNTAVDWDRVSEVAGVSKFECLELNRCNDKKSEWVYNIDTFSWDTANKMSDFIKANYPEPAPINFKAVSNYMWIHLSDCAQMYNLLNRNFKWTEEKLNQVQQLISQGISVRDAAKHMSPVMQEQALRKRLKYKELAASQPVITAEARQQMRKLVDKYVGKHDVTKIFQLVNKKLQIKSFNVRDKIEKIMSAHPFYKDRIKNTNVFELLRRVDKGEIDLAGAAKEIDVPYSLLKGMNEKHKSETVFHRKWTAEETEILVNYVKSQKNNTPNYIFASQLVGNRTPRQCSAKIHSLKKEGKI